MTDNQDLYCAMNLRLSRSGSAITMYDAKLGVRRRLQLRGIVHDDGWYPGDGPDDGAPHFHGKPVVVQIHSPVGPDKFEKMRAGLTADTAERIFGIATVNAGVKIETNHKKWMEYYAPDGTLRGKADSLGTFRGSYEFKDNVICYSYQGHGDWNWCSQVSAFADRIYLLEDGKLVTNESNTEMLPGNPHNL